jgi:quinol monooxygenase YgiN
MVIVAGTISIDSMQLDAFDQAVKAMIGGVRSEHGCIQYSLLVEDHVSGLINVLEIWRDENSLKVHLKQPAIVEFFTRFSPHITGMTAQLYDAENARPVPM